MHSDNRPPTLHGEDRTHMATDTQRHLSLHPGPCRGARLWGRNLPQGEVSLSGGIFLQPPGEAPTISRRSQADKWEWGQQLVPNPVLK